MKRERLRVFFDELAKNPEGLTEEIVQTEDFIHCFLRTSEAVLRSRRLEKIQHFARLLGATTKPGAFGDIDEFEDLLDALASTSDRELAVLVLLRRYELRELDDSTTEDALRCINNYWPRFRTEALELSGIPLVEFYAFMSRLERTGLYSSILGGMWDNRMTGRTTPQFAKLAALILGGEGVQRD